LPPKQNKNLFRRNNTSYINNFDVRIVNKQNKLCYIYYNNYMYMYIECNNCLSLGA